MTIGIGQWSEKNIEEVWFRLKLLEQLDGAWVRGESNIWNTPLTAGDVRQHIGLNTNVSYEPPTKWANRVLKYERGLYSDAWQEEVQS